MKVESPSNEQRDVLIVDDEESNLNYLEAILQSEGYRLRRAASGEEALDEVKKKTPDLVVMDVCMPGISGFEACREIKANCTNTFIPVMMVTALDEINSKVEGLDSGADDYVVKPPQKEEMRARVRALLRIRDLQQTLLTYTQKLKETNEQLVKAQKTIDKELDQVGAIQRSFIPSKFPWHPEIEFARMYEPCQQAGGDYFDVIEIGRSLWGILIADVTGHGTPAAVVMAITHTIMHSFISTFRYPSTALKVANEKLNEHLAPTFYVTMFYGVLDLDNMTFRYASAGHEPMILYRSRTNSVEYLQTDYGFPLKLVESDDYDEKVVELEPDDKIVLFTDGIVEARDPNGQLFSPQRLEKLVLKYHTLPPNEFVKTVISEVESFASTTKFKDDVSLLLIQRKSSGG